MEKLHVKKDDLVVVLSGESKGVRGKVIAASWWGKVKTNVQMFAIMIAMIIYPQYEIAANELSAKIAELEANA